MTTIKLIPHDGGPCPVEDVSGFYRLRDGYLGFSFHLKIAGFWEHAGGGCDIIAYCPIEIEEGE